MWLGALVGAELGAVVLRSVGDPLGMCVRDTADGALVPVVGNTVGFLVGLGVGERVGAAVGDSVALQRWPLCAPLQPATHT